MKIPEVNPFIIGAGGVASYLLPVLTKTFPCPKLWLRDADKLEEKNLDRQLFRNDQIGQSKAEALLTLLGMVFPGKPEVSDPIGAWPPQNDRAQADSFDSIANRGAPSGAPDRAKNDWIAQTQWFSEGETPPPDASLVICVADNHTARRAAIFAAEDAGIPCVLGGNEYYDSQALWMDPMDRYTKYDPLIRYPKMQTDTTMNPIRCQGEALISTPQLAMANMRCASHILDLMWLHLVILPEIAENPAISNKGDLKKSFPLEIFTSQNSSTYVRYNEI